MLAEYVAGRLSSSDGRAHPAWGRLLEFCAEWCELTSTAHALIHQIWLECDDPCSSPLSTAPSVFVGLRADVRPADSLRLAAESALAKLGGKALSAPVVRTLQDCFGICADGGFVSHVGLMLSRRGDGLRVNLRRLPAEAIIPCLARVGWRGPTAALARVLAESYSVAEAITVCLDIGAEIDPRVGLECYLPGTPESNPAWAAFLDGLVARGSCTPEKRDALLVWPHNVAGASPSATSPGESGTDKLHRTEADRPPALVRKISHIKLVLQPTGPIEAKAYIGIVQERPRTAADPRELPPLPLRRASPRQPQLGRMPVARMEERITAAMEAAIDFLLEARTLAGWWCDFPRAAGWSDEWVTAFTGATIARVEEERVLRAVRQAWSLLGERRPQGGGWGYNLSLPEDADSTAWGLRLAAAVGAEGSARAQRARQFLETHRLSDGGLVTYREENCPRNINPALIPADGSKAGWCHTPHSCVTAVAAGLVGERPHGFLRRMQLEDGSWKSYWWEGGEYATALAAEALATTGRAADRVHVQAAVRWAADRIAPDGVASSTDHATDSAFAAAWCLRTLALAEDIRAVRGPLDRAIGWLLGRQSQDGAWPPSARLRVPALDAIDPVGQDTPRSIFLDEAAIFTTATVLAALEAARSRLERP